MRLPRYLTPHRVLIRPHVGDDSNGPLYGEPVEVPAYVEDGQRLVWVGGQQTPSSARVWVNLGAPASVGCEVTIWPGVTPEWPGQPMTERALPCIDVTVRQHPGTPNHLVLDLV